MSITDIGYNAFKPATAPLIPGHYLPVSPVRPVPAAVTTQPTIFIDRDGVINQNRKEHVLNWNEFEFIEGSKKALALLKEAGYGVVVVTNQATIERGLLGSAQLDQMHQQMAFEIEKAGGQVMAVYYCPHRPEANCDCRKPKPGLLLKAASQLQITLRDSWFIGDHLTDIEAGLAAGCKPLLVQTGRGLLALKELQGLQPGSPALNRLTVRYGRVGLQRLPVKSNLLEAVNYILATRKG